MEKRADFWDFIDALVSSSQIVIDRPRGSRHPRYPEMIYPLDYGYLAGTLSADGREVDLWRGSLADPLLEAILLSVDLVKRDVEINLLLGCTQQEMALALEASQSGQMAATIVRRGKG
jgi:inorganic pyrophosphatase